MYGQQPILVLSQNTKRESGRKVQIENISAGKAIADVIRTCLGPQAMLKMLMDPMGGIVMTNDGNAILREITVQHPAAKSMIEIARTQDEEVGDGTTSVIVLAGEMLAVAEQFLVQNIHPTVIIREYRQALEDAIVLLQEKISVPVDINDKEKLKEVIRSCVGTKYIGRWSDLAVDIALDAVNTVTVNDNGRVEVDIKNYAKVEKIPGGSIEESKVLNGVMINKDVTHPKMRRYIENPRIILLDCPLEYKKGESQTNIEIVGEQDFTKLLQLEEEHVQRQCADIIALKPDIVFTEKGVSDLAQHYLVKAGITAIRRLRKTDNNRLARACGATIVNRTEELREEDVGTQAGKFEIKKIGDEYFTFVTECKNPKACTILLRGASKDVLNEIERNLQDALHVAKNLVLNPRLVAGGGAVEMAVSQALSGNAAHNTPYRAVASALEIIPRTLAQNCGANTIRSLTALRARHAAGPSTDGIYAATGEITDMAAKKIWEPLAVKLQVYKTAVETAILLLRIDDIVSGSKKRAGNEPATPAQMANMQEINTIKMEIRKTFMIWCGLVLQSVLSVEIQHGFEEHSKVSVDEAARGRRDVIEEEKYYNIHTNNHKENQPWMPGPLPPQEDASKISIANDEGKEVLPLNPSPPQTTERATDKPTGRGARASNENWIKLPFPDRNEVQRDEILTPPQPSGDLINSRMPRVNFVTQNKGLETSESRDKESIQRALRTDNLRTEFVRPDEDDRPKQFKPVYPRQAVYYPEESRRLHYDDRYAPIEDLYRRDYYDTYDRRRYPGYGRVDRYDEGYDNYVPRKPKRIIYYAHLPEVVRTPPSVDLRYRYSVDPYRRDDDYYARNGRYDYRFRNRYPYPYAPLRKEERNYRDLAGAGTANKDKKIEEKVTPAPVLPKEDKYKNTDNRNRNLINSHQYHDGLVINYEDPMSHKSYQDVRQDDHSYLRFDEPLFQATIEDPYQRKY